MLEKIKNFGMKAIECHRDQLGKPPPGGRAMGVFSLVHDRGICVA